MKASVIKVDMAGAVRKVAKLKGDNRLGTYAAQQAGDLMDKYVPFREGILASYKAEPWSVVYSVPYAARMYYGRGVKAYSKDRHPLAKSHWDDALKADPSPLAARINGYLGK